MLYYRLYFMHPDSGHIERFADFEAPDDAHAVSLASEHAGEQPLELWNERRKVQRIETASSVPSSRQDAA